MNNSLLKKYAIYTKKHLILHLIGSLMSQFLYILLSGKVKAYEEIFINPSTYISILTFYIFVTIFDFSFSMIIDRYKRAKNNTASEVIISKSDEQFYDNCIYISKDTEGDMIEIGIKDDDGVIVDQMAFTTEQAKCVARSINQILESRGVI